MENALGVFKHPFPLSAHPIVILYLSIKIPHANKTESHLPSPINIERRLPYPMDTADALSFPNPLLPLKPYLLARTSFIPATSLSQSIP